PARGRGGAALPARARARGRGQPDDPAHGMDRARDRDPPLGPAAHALADAGGDAVMVVRGLTRAYGTLVALDQVSLEVGRGEIVGLLGANGAGKSTLLRVCAGLQPPDQGAVEVIGV